MYKEIMIYNIYNLSMIRKIYIEHILFLNAAAAQHA